MIGQVVKCEKDGCDVVFTKKTHNQKYHDNECCRLATNANIKEKYHNKKEIKSGAERYCKSSDCEHKLSRYNHSSICNSCALKNTIDSKNSIMTMLTSVSWQ